MLTSIRLTLRKKSTLIVPLLLAVFCLSATDVLATHFRYGHLSWRVRRDLGSNVAEFTLFNAFRRDGYSGRGADGHPITGDIITDTIGETVLNFGDGTSLGTLDYIVIAYDPVANWVFCKPWQIAITSAFPSCIPIRDLDHGLQISIPAAASLIRLMHLNFPTVCLRVLTPMQTPLHQ